MNTPAANTTEKILGAIFGGCLATIIIACLQLPLVYLAFDSFFELNLFGTRTTGWKITALIISCLTWLFISMMAGGYVSARIARQNEYHIAWTIIGIGFLIFIVYANTEYRSGDFPMLLIMIGTGILGTLAGCHNGIQYKERKRKDQARVAR